MKKGMLATLLILVFAAGIMAADGPVDKGSMILGGNVYFMSQGGDFYKGQSATGDDAATTFGIMPTIGYFFAPSIVGGVMADFTSWSQGDDKETYMLFGPWLGYYFNMDAARTEAKGAVYPYVKAFFMFGSDKWEFTGDPDTYKITNTAFGGQAGINYMMTNSVALDIGVSFMSESYKQKEPVESSDSVSGTTIMFGVGFTQFIF